VYKFDLPTISPDAHPEFTDAKDCAAWLQTVPLINVTPSHVRLLGQLEECNCFEVEPTERLRILELLIEPIVFVQIEQAKKYTGRPVPLTKPERDFFLNVVALWDALAQGYLHCLNSIAEGNPALAGQHGLVCQRALWCAGQRLAEHYRCCQALSGEDWTLLHRLFAIAEDRGVLDKPVPQPTLKARSTSCLRTYVQSLLLHLASDPSEQSLKQMAMVSRWLEGWSQQVRIGRTPPASEPDLVPLAVDIAAERGPVHALLSGDSVRFVDLVEFAKGIRSRVARLRKGDTPEALGLGDDISAAAAEQLLLVIHRLWCEEPKPRTSTRRAVATKAQLCSGLPAMHYYISGKPFRQPVAQKELTKEQREEIATFGRIATRQDDEHSSLQGFVIEAWTIREESLGGLRIERSEDGGKGRFVQQQLIAVRPADAKSFMLGIVRWLSVSDNFELRIGVRILPGVVQCVAVRATGLNAMAEKYVQALLLPAIPALQSPATLILPVGWYRPKRMVEVYSDKAEQILLTGIVDRGADFERVGIGAP
jgi:cyclic-di-GMP-binding protein